MKSETELFSGKPVIIASDVTDLRHIDTSAPPDPRLHQVRIADAIAQGKPQVIVFATPKFCTSRVCGPVVEIVRLLLPTYGDWVAPIFAVRNRLTFLTVSLNVFKEYKRFV